jgi:hypothetical protein
MLQNWNCMCNFNRRTEHNIMGHRMLFHSVALKGAFHCTGSGHPGELTDLWKHESQMFSWIF